VTTLHRNVAVLRVADAQALAELRALVPLENFVLGEIAPNELVLDPNRVRELQEALEARGLSPLVRRLRSEESG
jgi:hypothetical protein